LWVASLLAVTATVLLTGAFHEDGLADTADALGGASEREKVLDILKDSRVGTFGAAALFLSLGLRVALLERLGAFAAIALVLAHGLSRAPPVWLMWALPYVSRDEVSKSKQIARAGRGQVLVATFWGALLLGISLLAGWMTPSVVIWTAGALAAVALLCGWRFRARLGGLTGDFLGAAQQIAECSVLLVCALERSA
jgi:adenosylcobinamide-GDP ribazoletransferase